MFFQLLVRHKECCVHFASNATQEWNPTKKPFLQGQQQQIGLFNSMSTSIFGQVPGFLLKATEITRVESLKLGSPDKKSKQLLPAAS